MRRATLPIARRPKAQQLARRSRCREDRHHSKREHWQRELSLLPRLRATPVAWISRQLNICASTRSFPGRRIFSGTWTRTPGPLSALPSNRAYPGGVPPKMVDTRSETSLTASSSANETSASPPGQDLGVASKGCPQLDLRPNQLCAARNIRSPIPRMRHNQSL